MSRKWAAIKLPYIRRTRTVSMKDTEKQTEDDEREESFGACIGRCCAHCMIHHIDIPIFFVSLGVLYLSMDRCCYCVMVVAIISALMCLRFPILNATLWSAIIVLYMHKDWHLNFGDVKVTWNRAT